MISRPTFIPDLNSCFTDSDLSVSKISFTVLAIETAVSINAPSALIIIDADRIPVKLKSGLAVYKNIFSSPAKPVRCAKYIASIDNAPAKIKLMLVPIIADELFEFRPPTKYMVIIVDIIPVRTADAIGQKPLNIIGNNIKNIKAIVEIIDIILVSPFFLPIKISRIKNIPVNTKI